MDIVVLAGGLSVERDVSLSSGSLVLAALKKLGHRAVLVDAFLGTGALPANIKDAFGMPVNEEAYVVKTKAPDMAALIASRGEGGFGEIGENVIELCRAADIVYLALHGENGENGRMQAFFDILGIKYTGAGYLGSALAMNKALSKELLMDAGVKVPRGVRLKKCGLWPKTLGVGFPCVVKPCSGGSSIGVSIAKNEAELREALCAAYEYGDEALVEEYISGREFAVGVLGDVALPAIEIIPGEGFYDYEHKYQAGMTREVCPAEISEQQSERMQEAAIRAFEALMLEVYARGEFMMDAGGEIYCLEMNTLPGMTPTSLLPQEAAAAGIDYEGLCGRIISLSLKKYEA